MKTLNDILKVQTVEDGFPVKGRSGYGGEQDGSRVILGLFHVPSRATAGEIVLSEAVRLHWATYTPGIGWNGAVGYWSDSDVSDQEMGDIRW